MKSKSDSKTRNVMINNGNHMMNAGMQQILGYDASSPGSVSDDVQA